MGVLQTLTCHESARSDQRMRSEKWRRRRTPRLNRQLLDVAEFPSPHLRMLVMMLVCALHLLR
jgi:hypothetical protein